MLTTICCRCCPGILYSAHTHTHTKHTVTGLQPTHNQQRYGILMGNRLKLQIRLLLCLLLQTGTILADSCTSSNTCRTCRECSGVSKRFCENPISLAISLHILYFSFQSDTINYGKVTFTDFETVLHYYIVQTFLAICFGPIWTFFRHTTTKTLIKIQATFPRFIRVSASQSSARDTGC